MFKTLNKNIIPIILLLHISSCSSAGVSKNEMQGACGIIDEVLNNDLNQKTKFENLHDKLEKQQTIPLKEGQIEIILNNNNNKACLKKLKKNIEKWGKRNFTEALSDCLFLKDPAYTKVDGEKFTTKEEKLEYDKKYKKYYKNFFNNLAIIKDPDNYCYKDKYLHLYSYYNHNKICSDYEDMNINDTKKLTSVNGAHLSCARLIAVDLDQTTNQLSYRIKYLPYIFISGYNSNRIKINISLPYGDIAEKLYNSLCFIDDYRVNNGIERNGFSEEEQAYKQGNGLNLDSLNSHHTDSERALFLCLAADGTNIKYLYGKEPTNKLKDFVKPETIDLCIQRNMNPMCGNCQCFYAGIDKIDLINKKFLLRT